MIETIALVIVVIALVGLIGWLDWNQRKERAKLLNALLSKTPEQFRDLEFIEKASPTPVKSVPPDLVAADQMSDEEFAEMVGANNG